MNESCGILGWGVAFWALTAARGSGCGGAGGGSSAATSAPTSAAAVTPSVSGTPPSASSSTGSSSSGASGSSVSSSGVPSGASILFEQPLESGITGHLFVPPATHTAPPKGAFELVLWQPNPYRPDGLLVPTGLDAR